MTARGMWAVIAAAVAAGLGVVALVLTSDHQQVKAVWAIFGPVVGWSFIGTGLYAWRARPESRIGELMVLLGFAWFLYTLAAADWPPLHTAALVVGGLWGGVFLHLGLSFPSGRLDEPPRPRARDRGLRDLPAGLRPPADVRGAARDGVRGLPENLLLIRRDPELADVLAAFGALLYLALFVVVLIRAAQRWRRDAAARAPPAHAGLRVCVAHLRVRDGGPRRCRRPRLVARVHRDRAACRSPSSAACCAATSPSSTPSCARGWRSCRPRARGSSRPATPSGAASSATCTTARSPASSRSRSCCARRARAPGTTPSWPPCSTAPSRSFRRASPSCASSRAASTRPC